MDHLDSLTGPPDLNGVIGEIYEIAFAENAIPRTLDLLRRTTRSRCAIFCHRDIGGGGIEESSGIDPEFDAPMARLMHCNLLAHRTHLVQVGQPICSTDLVRPEEWRGNPLYEEVWKPAGLHRCLGVLFARDQRQISTLALFREARDPAHEAQMHEIAAVLSPHLRRAMALRRSVLCQQSRAGALREALDLLALPVLIAEASGRIVHANRAGEEALRAVPHLALSHRRLAACEAADRDRLQALLCGIEQGCGSSITLGAGSPAPAWLLAAPLTEDRASGLGLPQGARLGLIAIQTATALPCSHHAVLRSLFDLSPAEADLAVALGHGQTLAQVAAEREVTLNTVRSQLKALFAKTGVSRQPELARLVTGIDQLRH